MALSNAPLNGKSLCILSTPGGSWKTTNLMELAAAFAVKNLKVLLADFTTSANLSAFALSAKGRDGNSRAEAARGSYDAINAIMEDKDYASLECLPLEWPVEGPAVHLLPSSGFKMSELTLKMGSGEKLTLAVSKLLDSMSAHYHVILVDYDMMHSVFGRCVFLACDFYFHQSTSNPREVQTLRQLDALFALAKKHAISKLPAYLGFLHMGQVDARVEKRVDLINAATVKFDETRKLWPALLTEDIDLARLYLLDDSNGQAVSHTQMLPFSLCELTPDDKARNKYWWIFLWYSITDILCERMAIINKKQP